MTVLDRKQEKHMTKNLVSGSSKFTTSAILESDAWPESIRKQYAVSKVHNIFKKEQEIRMEDISFGVVGEEQVEEVRKLHEEWFPIYYNHKYFEKASKNKDYI